MAQSTRLALLALEDGTLWTGFGFGIEGETTGEVVFNTSMTGYQEILTDPSYDGQIVTMTAPQIGNVGVNDEDEESRRVWMSGFVVRELSSMVSNYRAQKSLDEYLKLHGVVGISGVSTRALVIHIRTAGAMRAALSNIDPDPSRLVNVARNSRDMKGTDLAREVTCDEPYHWAADVDKQWYQSTPAEFPSGQANQPHIVVIDFGVKYNILRLLKSRGCEVTVVPGQTSAKDVLSLHPDGVLLSNGPGDPAACTYAINATRELLDKVPIFGICLGHQIMGLALGGSTYKMKFGHRGGNQPVSFSDTSAIEISSHNHGFAVLAESLPGDVEITHVNLNDGCVEGIRARGRRAFGVQYHPEASPGPHDSGYLFDEFMKEVCR
jgi:carbamoyl-phosphate synthase small subunit